MISYMKPLNKTGKTALNILHNTNKFIPSYNLRNLSKMIDTKCITKIKNLEGKSKSVNASSNLVLNTSMTAIISMSFIKVLLKYVFKMIDKALNKDFIQASKVYGQMIDRVDKAKTSEVADDESKAKLSDQLFDAVDKPMKNGDVNKLIINLKILFRAICNPIISSNSIPFAYVINTQAMMDYQIMHHLLQMKETIQMTE